MTKLNVPIHLMSQTTTLKQKIPNYLCKQSNSIHVYQNSDFKYSNHLQIDAWNNQSNWNQSSNMLFNLHNNLKNYEKLQKKETNSSVSKTEKKITFKRPSSVKVPKIQSNNFGEQSQRSEQIKTSKLNQKDFQFRRTESKQILSRTIQQNFHKKYKQLQIQNHGLFEKANNPLINNFQKNVFTEALIKNDKIRKISQKKLNDQKIKSNINNYVDLCLGFLPTNSNKKQNQNIRFQKKNLENIPDVKSKTFFQNRKKKLGGNTQSIHKEQFQNQFEDTKLFLFR